MLTLSVAVTIGVMGCSSRASTDQADLASAKSGEQRDDGASKAREDNLFRDAVRTLRDGRHTFRFDTFGDEDFWGGQLRIHEAIEGAKLGGVGAGVSPKTRSPSASRWTSMPSPCDCPRARRREPSTSTIPR